MLNFRFVFWDVLPYRIIVYRRFRGTCCLHHQGDEMSVDDYFTRQYIPEDKSELHTRRRWELEISHLMLMFNSGSIVSDYGLNDRAIGVRSPAGAEDFSSSLCVQIGSGAHPASCTMGTGGPFPRGKARPGRDADHSPHLVPRSWMSRSYISSPPKRLHGV
jgi:hypothetical protein